MVGELVKQDRVMSGPAPCGISISFIWRAMLRWAL